ncbi:MAG: response regulator [Desulfobacterales bacterium]|nr:response regulator [Desulfobacterales bacterium]
MAKILIVDDRPYIPDLLLMELATEGYRVRHVVNTIYMWEQLKNLQPDVVLIDHYLNGNESWKILLDINKQCPDLPVLVYIINNVSALYRIKQTVTAALGKKISVS